MGKQYKSFALEDGGEMWKYFDYNFLGYADYKKNIKKFEYGMVLNIHWEKNQVSNLSLQYDKFSKVYTLSEKGVFERKIVAELGAQMSDDHIYLS